MKPHRARDPKGRGAPDAEGADRFADVFDGPEIEKDLPSGEEGLVEDSDGVPGPLDRRNHSSSSPNIRRSRDSGSPITLK